MGNIRTIEESQEIQRHLLKNISLRSSIKDEQEKKMEDIQM